MLAFGLPNKHAQLLFAKKRKKKGGEARSVLNRSRTMDCDRAFDPGHSRLLLGDCDKRTQSKPSPSSLAISPSPICFHRLFGKDTPYPGKGGGNKCEVRKDAAWLIWTQKVPKLLGRSFLQRRGDVEAGPRGLLFLTYCDYKIVFSLLPSEEASKREENGLLGKWIKKKNLQEDGRKKKVGKDLQNQQQIRKAPFGRRQYGFDPGSSCKICLAFTPPALGNKRFESAWSEFYSFLHDYSSSLIDT